MPEGPAVAPAGDGKILIIELKQAVRLRTGETGKDAL
jgi:nitrogen regulatory protein PII